MIWFAAPLASRAVKIVVTLVGGLVCLLLMGLPMLGILMQPLAPYWLSGQHTVAVGGVPGLTVPAIDVSSSSPVVGLMVSDVQRYLLAIGAGWSQSDAIIAVAISIAEDGSGNPAAISGRNFDGSVDQGLWQVNSGWNSKFGGQAALLNPVTNAIAAHTIYTIQGWCAWSTFEARCGPGHTGSYAAFMNRAHAAAQGGH